MGQTAIRVKDIAKRYRLGRHEGYQLLRDRIAETVRALPQRFFSGKLADREGEAAVWALDGVSFEIGAGEVVGIIGRNGAGKTTLLKILSRITAPTRGEFELHGRVGALLEVGTGFHGELTGRENIYLSGAVLGMKKAEIQQKFDGIVEFAEVERFLDTPVKRYSTGMYMRLAFAIAAHLEPEIMLVDEILAVGDAAFQRKCLDRMELAGKAGRTILFVSHNVLSVMRLCTRAILLERGAVVADGPPHEVVKLYLSSHSGSSAERSWSDIEQAPGDSVARLRAVRVVNKQGDAVDVADVSEPFQIEMEYWQLEPARRAVPELRFFNEDGVCLFATADMGLICDREQVEAPRLVRAICDIPPHLLAEGRVFVQASVISYGYPSTVHAVERDAVGIQMTDRRDNGSPLEHYAGSWPGVVRPKLEWKVWIEGCEFLTSSSGWVTYQAE